MNGWQDTIKAFSPFTNLVTALLPDQVISILYTLENHVVGVFIG